MVERRILVALATVALVATMVTGGPASAAPTVEPHQGWQRQFGGGGADTVTDVDISSTSIFVTGFIGDEGVPFLRRYRDNGATVWTRHLYGSPTNAPGRLDVYGSAVYVATSTGGLSGSSDQDAILRKYDLDGTMLWARRIATDEIDGATAVRATPDGVYVAGHTRGSLDDAPRGQRDAWLRKYSATGAHGWTAQFGTTENDRITSVVAVPDGVVVAGDTGLGLPGHTASGGTEAFMRKYGARGAQGWTRQFGSSGHDWINGATVSGDAIYVGGSTTGTLGSGTQGGEDAYLRRVTLDGREVWTRQFGTPQREYVLDVEANGPNLYIAGSTSGTLRGGYAAGGYDAFARRYTPNGGLIWTYQFGTPETDWGNAVDAGGMGVIVGGATFGAIPEGYPDPAEADAFVQRVISARPDGLLSLGDGNGYVGSDVYGYSGAGQARSVTLDRGARQIFYIRAQNDADNGDGFEVEGCSGNTGFAVRYFTGLSGGTDITDEVVDGTYVLSNIAPNAVRTFRVVITVRNAADTGETIQCLVRMWSVIGFPDYYDTVAPIVRVG